MYKYTGIDVSKASLDVAFCDEQGHWQWQQFSNDLAGFKKLLKFSPVSNTLVMEASGPYYVQLVNYLHGQGKQVCVVNPLQIRRSSQMRMYRAKTDRKDAQVIAEFANTNKPARWEPIDHAIKQMQQVITALEGIHKLPAWLM